MCSIESMWYKVKWEQNALIGSLVYCTSIIFKDLGLPKGRRGHLYFDSCRQLDVKRYKASFQHDSHSTASSVTLAVAQAQFVKLPAHLSSFTK